MCVPARLHPHLTSPPEPPTLLSLLIDLSLIRVLLRHPSPLQKNERLAIERERELARKNKGYAALFTEEAGYGVAARPGIDSRFSSKRENELLAQKGAGASEGRGKAGDILGDEGGEEESDGEGSQDDFW